MQLHHFPSPNPQKITFALQELGHDCEIVPVDLAKGEHRLTAFLALDPLGRVPVLVDGDLILPKSHAVLAYLGENTARLWPTSAAGRAETLRWLFFPSQHISAGGGGGVTLSREAVRAPCRKADGQTRRGGVATGIGDPRRPPSA